ncbi:TcaA NTF2-like domain-containing protein [Salisediminibacterium selenitireducens]|uniref:TcaA NTF2-like domain-containing protein n=1 Tax=Salisediminibacterium selenitireducens TaxID=85683 RepID=UPI0003245299|nr:hypothetical protein [Salisediminibacterium selenitireducens]
MDGRKPEPEHKGEEVRIEKQIQEEESMSSDLQEQSPKPPTRTKKPLSKKKKATIGVAVAGVALLFGSYQVMTAQFTPEKTVEGIFDAVAEGDKERLGDYLVRADGEELEDHQLTLMIDMLQDPFLFEEVKNDMNLSALQYRENEAIAGEDHTFSSDIPIALEQKGKKLMIFDDYAAVLYPLDMEVRLDYEDVAWSLNGEEVSSYEVSTGIYSLGPQYLGTYDLSVEIDMAFGRHEIEETVVHDGRWLEVPLHMEALEIISHISGAELYVNDAVMDITLEHGETFFDRVLYDEGMMLHAVADTPFGEMASEPVPLDESKIELKYAVGEDLAEELMDMRFAELDAGRFLDDYSDVSEVNEVPVAISFIPEEAYLQEGKQDMFWQVTIPYRETWQSPDETGGEESVRDYELVLILPGDDDEWRVQELWVTNEQFSGEWITRSYDEEAQFAYLEELQTMDGKASYRANETAYLNELINGFHDDNVNAINGGDKSRAVRMIHEDAGAYKKTVTDYIDYLRGRNITQEFKGSDVIGVSEGSEEDIYIVKTEDLYIIHNNDEDRSREAKFLTEYKVVLTDDGYYLLELESTEQLWSESL